ncbi:MAG: ubiquitin-like protein Pup, partial [Actinobacteria bacterium]|nr:ubiquitin-like protein Pup [Actinomycetota bacterium]
RKQGSTRKSSSSETEELAADSTGADQLKADLDDLLDEIDGVLEDNAEEFVRNYVQKGGE